jgi:hypothetical protein
VADADAGAGGGVSGIGFERGWVQGIARVTAKLESSAAVSGASTLSERRRERALK